MIVWKTILHLHAVSPMLILQAVSWKDSELGTEGGGDQEGKRNNLEGHVFAPVSV